MAFVYYGPNESEWKRIGEASYKIDGGTGFQIYENAIVLPLKKREDISSPDGVFSGGICALDYTFLAGHRRNLNNSEANYSCETGYIPLSGPEFRNERVVFGGFLYKHFGHMLLEGMARLWYVVKNRPSCKIVFLAFPNRPKVSCNWQDFFSLLDIDEDQVEIISSPTQFKEIIVPDESLVTLSGYCETYPIVYEYMQKKVVPTQYKKIYFSRTEYSKGTKYQGFINEQYFENFYAKRGFKVVHPEQLSLYDQIALVAGADEFVSMLGTMTHLLLFAKSSIKATILVRSPFWVEAQFLIDQAKKICPSYVYATRNILPSVHTTNAFLFSPNKYFRRYLDEKEISYDSKELELDKKFPFYCYEYLMNYDHAMQKASSRENILNNASIEDVLDTVHDAFSQQDGLKGDWDFLDFASEFKKEKAKRIRLEKELEKKKREIEKIRNSKSWKITRPLRKIISFLER